MYNDILRLPHSLRKLGEMIEKFDMVAHASDRAKLPAALESIKKIADAVSKRLPGSPGVISITGSQEFQEMLALGLVVAAIADLSPDVIAAAGVRIDQYIEDIGRQAAAHEKFQAEAAAAKHDAEILEQARKLHPSQIIANIESTHGLRVALDGDKIVTTGGAMSHAHRLMINARRDDVVRFLEQRQQIHVV